MPGRRGVSETLVCSVLLLAATGVLTCGGIGVQVARGQLRVRLGVLGLRLLRVGLDDIASVAVQPFNAMSEFGGWGPGRYGRPAWAKLDGRQRGVWAFYFRGTEGVKIVRKDGRMYLIGSDHPDRLAAVLTAATHAPAPTA